MLSCQHTPRTIGSLDPDCSANNLNFTIFIHPINVTRESNRGKNIPNLKLLSITSIYRDIKPENPRVIKNPQYQVPSHLHTEIIIN